MDDCNGCGQFFMACDCAMTSNDRFDSEGALPV